MASIETEPIRRPEPSSYIRKRIPVLEQVRLPAPLAPRASFLRTLLNRRSAELFPRVTAEDLSSFLYYTASTQQLDTNDENRQRRFVASMGALHPAEVVLFRPKEGWFVYLAGNHSLGRIATNDESASALLRVVHEHFDAEEATVIVLISDHELALNYYENPDSLLLRDAGVLLGHASLVAAAYGLAFRVLGRTGRPFSHALIGNIPFTPSASGMALLGGQSLSF